MTERRTIGEFLEGLAFGAVGVILGLIGATAPWWVVVFIPAIVIGVLQDGLAQLLHRPREPRRILRAKGRAFVLTPAIGSLIAGALWNFMGGPL